MSVSAVRGLVLSFILVLVSGVVAAESGGSGSAYVQDGGDLVIEVQDPAAAISFRTQEFSEDSCEISEGCALGSGRRSLLEIAVAVRNIGRAAIDLGHPWESPYFAQSLCQQSQTLYGFMAAELRDASGAVVARGSLASNCVADAVGGFTCMAQGLGPQGVSQQPASQCDYLDVTGLASGQYTLRLTVNPDGTIPESDRRNNSVELPLDYVACAGAVCAGVCCPEGVACQDGVCMLPDLRINAESATQSLTLRHQTFDENSCELAEMCVSGSGRRRLLQFEGRIENWGPGDLAPGDEHDNPLFEFSMCHEHYHFLDFTDYKLLDANGAVVAQGHKQSFCLVNMAPLSIPSTPAPPGTRPEPEPELEPTVGPHGESSGCNLLQAGWADIYSLDTPCQWVDVTDVPEGDYVLQLSVNPLGRIVESVTDNNTVLIPVNLPPDVPCVPEPEICGDPIDQDCDEQPDTWDDDCYGVCLPGSPFCDPAVEVSGNETCEGAYVLPGPGAYGGALALGTQAAACGGEGGGAYFRFTLDREQAVYVGGIGSALDTVVGVYRDDCSAEPLRCADDSCGETSGHFVDILQAGTYVAVLRAKQPEGVGRYYFKFQVADAMGALLIEGPGVYSGDTRNSDDSIAACGELEPTGAGPDDIYVFASCNAPLAASTCGTSSFRSVIDVRTATPSEWGPTIQCQPPGGGQCASDPLGSAITAFSYSSGLTFVTVDGVGVEDAGEYQLSISY